ncbi:MAG TPA: helix-turn-helix transcriptional regulator [Vicinamibacteria bacterium]|nr:helix-turn-helix transcriptional regulator [Vicinamibacteria bacterium]
MSPASATPRTTRLAPVFAALGDPTRLVLMTRLCGGRPLSIAQLTMGTKVTRQAVTKHLSVLAVAGLVSDFRGGRERLWQPEPRGLDEASRYLEVIGRRWDAALERLKRFVER